MVVINHNIIIIIIDLKFSTNTWTGIESRRCNTQCNKMACKREHEMEEFEDISKVLHPSPKAKINAVLTNVSPMKRSKTCSFFDGEITDGKSTMRVFGFDDTVRRKLISYEESKSPVMFENCEVKPSRKGNQLEVLLTKYTEISSCQKTFDITKISATKFGKDISLSELKDLATFTRVSLAVKAVTTERVTEVPGGKKKQDIVIADSTGTARFTVWEGEIGKVKEGKCYNLKGMMVREFRGRKFLSTSKANSEIEEVSDIGEVADPDDQEESSNTVALCAFPARIIGVMQLDKYRGCLKCNTKLVPDIDNPDLGNCQKCCMLQCIDSGKQGLCAQFLIDSHGEKFTLRAFGNVIEKIAEKSANDISMGTLLKTKPFFMVHVDGIIQSISRKD